MPTLAGCSGVSKRVSGHLVGVVGAAGLGKSRLIAEFSALAASRGVQVVLARCDAHTTTVAFRALSRLLRAMFAVDGLNDADARAHALAQCGGALASGSADAQILFEMMGIADPDAPPLQVSVDGRRRRLVEVMSQAVQARSARILFVLEDAHWIDAPSDEVLADFADALTATSVDVRHDVSAGVSWCAAAACGRDDHTSTADRRDGGATWSVSFWEATRHWQPWCSGSRWLRWAIRSLSRRSCVTWPTAG